MLSPYFSRALFSTHYRPPHLHLICSSHDSNIKNLTYYTYSPIGMNEKVPQLRRDMPLKKLQVRTTFFFFKNPVPVHHILTKQQQQQQQQQQSLFKLKIEKCTEVYDFKSQTENKV